MDTDTLDSVIDPALQDPLPTQDDSSTFDPPSNTLSNSQPTFPAPKGKRKRKPFPPGSAADYKRKEANRLAAERSRSRASEKAKALTKAHAQLTAEQEELLAAISRYESLNQGGSDVGLDVDVDAQEREKRALDEQMEAAIKAAQGGSDPVTTQQEQDRADRNILAALMAGDMFEEGDWGEVVTAAASGEGMESLLKQTDGSGRLGELAAVATVPGDKVAETNPTDNDNSTSDVPVEGKKEIRSNESVDLSMEKLAEELKEGKAELNVPSPRLHDFTYNAIDAATATASAVAVVLNTEIERVVRDDVALTRAAIARVEKEIARAKGEAVSEDLEEYPPVRLPEEVLSYDKAELESSMEVAEESRLALEKGVEELQSRVKEEKEKKVELEGQVARGVQEMYKLAEGAEGLEKGKIMDVLKSIRGYIGNLIWGIEDETTDDTLLGTSFSTPAIARRRRGRPPKNTFPLRYNHASLIYPSLPLDSPNSSASLPPSLHPTPRDKSVSHPTTPAEQTPKVRKRRGVRGKRSTLSTTVPDSSSFDTLPITSTTNAEEYILSHLQASTEAASAAPPLLGEDGLPISHGSSIDPAFQSLEWTESVLSRLKKGGPGSCDICARTETSVWRKLVLGGEDYRVCNACGLYHRKFGVIRPPSLWGDGAEAVKKRQKATGPEDGRRNRKVRKTVHGAEDPLNDIEGDDDIADQLEDDLPGEVDNAKPDENMVDEEVDEAGILAIQQSLRDAGREIGLGMAEAQEGAQIEGGGHVDLDLSGFETLEEELRGQGIFPDLDDQEE